MIWLKLILRLKEGLDEFKNQTGTHTSACFYQNTINSNDFPTVLAIQTFLLFGTCPAPLQMVLRKGPLYNCRARPECFMRSKD